MSGRRIDAHHHLWQYDPEEFAWIDETMAAIRRDFTVTEFIVEMASAGVDAAVLVQGRQSVAETEFLLNTAQMTPQIAGIVGWLPIAAPDFAAHLEAFAGNRYLKGLRHVVQGEAAGFLDGQAFNQGINRLAETGLVYDILIHSAQLQEATRFADGHPRQSFVLDHIAKPRIVSGEMEPWASDLRSLALRPNVACKISGMMTEDAPGQWTEARLRPYFEVVLEAFTPDRLMVGSDWPVLTAAACCYSRWWNIVETWIAALSQAEQAAILSENARRIYHLELTDEDTSL